MVFSFTLTVPTGPPQSIRAEPIDSNTLVLHWEPPLLEDRNGVIRIYIVNITELETGETMQHVSIELTISISSLHPHYVYQYSISAQTIASGPFSEPAVIQMPEAGMCTKIHSIAELTMMTTVCLTVNLASSLPPVNIVVSAISSTGFMLSWNDPPAEHHNGVIRNYSIIIIELNTDSHIQLMSQTPAQSFNSLHPHYNYSIQIATVTVAVGSYSPEIFVMTLSDGIIVLFLMHV